MCLLLIGVSQPTHRLTWPQVDGISVPMFAPRRQNGTGQTQGWACPATTETKMLFQLANDFEQFCVFRDSFLYMLDNAVLIDYKQDPARGAFAGSKNAVFLRHFASGIGN